MSVNQSSQGSGFKTFTNTLVGLFIVACAALIVYGQKDAILKSYHTGGLAPALPTSVVTIEQPGSSVVVPRSDAPAVPTQSLAQVEATSQAIYQATVQAAEPNVGQGGEPAVLVQKDAPDREPAGANVPTSEPIQPQDSGGAFGSKRVIVNPQETHQCLHAQVWVDGRGCKNPTPTN